MSLRIQAYKFTRPYALYQQSSLTCNIVITDVLELSPAEGYYRNIQLKAGLHCTYFPSKVFNCCKFAALLSTSIVLNYWKFATLLSTSVVLNYWKFSALLCTSRVSTALVSYTYYIDLLIIAKIIEFFVLIINYCFH